MRRERTATTGTRRPTVRAVRTWLLAALVLTLALSACSKGHGAAPTVDPSQREAARKYAQCMRDNGVPDFPDPDANGQLRGAGHEQQDNPTFQAAQEKCRALAPGSEHQKSDPATVEQLRQFSQCMRDHGLPDYPDPDANGQLRGVGHEQQDTPTFRAAMQACRQKLPGGGVHR